MAHLCIYLSAAAFLCSILVFGNARERSKDIHSHKHEDKEEFKQALHKKFSRHFCREVFGSDNSSEVPDFEIIFPYNVDEHALQRLEKNIDREKHFFLHFRAFGHHFHLNVSLYTSVAPGIQIIEQHSEEGIRRLPAVEVTHTTGHIVNDTNSWASLDHRSGMNGVIHAHGEEYVVAHVPKGVLNGEGHEQSHGAHIIYKRSSLLASHPASDESCGFSDMIHHIHSDLRRSRRSVGMEKPKKILELMLVADKLTVERYTKELITPFLKAQGNMLASMFAQHLAYPIEIAVTRIVLLEKDVFKDASSPWELLTAFTKWVKENNPANDNDPLHVDNAILFTRYHCKKDCLSGLAGSGMCVRDASQAIVVDKGLTSFKTAAHELGHNLGLLHDGSGINKDCPNGINVMASGNTRAGDGFVWSKCSSNVLDNMLSDKTNNPSWCLNDKPQMEKLVNGSFDLYGTIYDGNKQCDMAFGKGYTQCTQLMGNCATLYCRKPDSSLCYPTINPPVHGTKCGERQWCIYGECVKNGEKAPTPIDGGLSSWSEYTKCNRECGGGMQWKTRTCTNPRPQNGGKSCIGSTKAYFKTCGMKDCPAGTPSFRDVQCRAHGPNMKPNLNPKDPCSLICNWAYMGHVADGTRVPASKDVCLGGVIRKVGCDLQLESGAVPDRCGVCGGDGSNCNTYSGKNMNAFAGLGQHFVTKIPKGSKNIVVKEMGPTMSFLGVKVGTSSNFLYYLPQWSMTRQAVGATLSYVMNGYNFPDEIKFQGTINADISIYFYNIYRQPSRGVSWTYFGSGGGKASEAEYIVQSPWGKCSKSCAGGIQTRKVGCRRVDDKTPLSKSFCKSKPLVPASQECNPQPCPAKWHVRPWSPCSKSCGNGKRTRGHDCAQLHNDGKYYTVQNAADCKSDKKNLPLIENCNQVKCLSEWKLGNWSECSTTCGKGKMTRTIQCKRINEDGTVVVVRDLECVHTAKPSTVQACNEDMPCAGWFVKYGECSKKCGGGVKQPFVECIANGMHEPAKLCPSEKKPDISTIDPVSCNPHQCNPYSWVTTKGVCSVSCGHGTIPITVKCQKESDKSIVSDSNCLSDDKPLSSKSCYAGECPVAYIWKISWGFCSVTCGKGKINAHAYCHLKSNLTKVSNLLCDASAKPTTPAPKECTMAPCENQYSWNIAFGSCSKTCGKGIREPIVTCKDSSSSATADASKCKGVAPSPGNKDCNEGECPPTYSFKVVYSKCTVTCGNGIKTGTVKCLMDANGKVMADSYCTGERPQASSVPCTLPACPTYSWVASYGVCLRNCPTGIRVMVLHCEDNKNRRVDSRYCVKEKSKVPENQKCKSDKPCRRKRRSVASYFPVGCYGGVHNSQMGFSFIKSFRNSINWKKMDLTVKQCANAIQNDPSKKSFKYFTIQFYGECWGGEELVSKTYFREGTTKNCYMGTGGASVNYVYHFGAEKEITKLPPLYYAGCYAKKDINPLPEMFDYFKADLDWSKPISDASAAKVASHCAIAAEKRGYKVFGVMKKGECWSGQSFNDTYAGGGVSKDCHGDLGGNTALSVYMFL